jgi:tetratricopeptide (TPR) repeat protein
MLEKNVDPKSPFYLRLLNFYAQDLMFDGQYEKAADTFLQHFEKISDSNTRVYDLEKAILCYLNLGQIQKAKEIVDIQSEEFKKNPRFLLICADVNLLFDPIAAKNLFLTYLQSPIKLENTGWDFDQERFLVHPNLMLAKICLLQNKPVEAKKYLIQASNLTALSKTKSECIILGEKLKQK